MSLEQRQGWVDPEDKMGQVLSDTGFNKILLLLLPIMNNHTEHYALIIICTLCAVFFVTFSYVISFW